MKEIKREFASDGIRIYLLITYEDGSTKLIDPEEYDYDQMYSEKPIN